MVNAVSGHGKSTSRPAWQRRRDVSWLALRGLAGNIKLPYLIGARKHFDAMACNLGLHISHPRFLRCVQNQTTTASAWTFRKYKTKGTLLSSEKILECNLENTIHILLDQVSPVSRHCNKTYRHEGKLKTLPIYTTSHNHKLTLKGSCYSSSLSCGGDCSTCCSGRTSTVLLGQPR